MMRNNPGKTMVGVILLVGIIVLIGWLVNRGRKGGGGGSGEAVVDPPELTFGEGKVILKPENDTTSGYAMYEYSLGETLADNIDIKVTWKNGAGFAKNKVTKLVFKRFIAGKEIAKPVVNTKYIGDFVSGEEEIKGSDLKVGENGVGKNTIKVYYVTSEAPTSEIELGSYDVTITEQQLNTTINLDKIAEVIVPVTRSSLEAKLKDDPEYTRYSIISKSGAWRRDNLRLKASSDQIQVLNDSGSPMSLWSGGPNTFYVSDYMGKKMIHDGAKDSGKYWIYPGTGDVLVSGSQTVIFKSQVELDKALFDIIEGASQSPPPTPQPQPSPPSYCLGWGEDCGGDPGACCSGYCDMGSETCG